MSWGCCGKTSLFLVTIADLKRKSYVANEGKPIPMSTYDSITFFVLSPCYGLTLTETTCRTLSTRQITTLDIYERQRMFDYGWEVLRGMKCKHIHSLCTWRKCFTTSYVVLNRPKTSVRLDYNFGQHKVRVQQRKFLLMLPIQIIEDGCRVITFLLSIIQQ